MHLAVADQRGAKPDRILTDYAEKLLNAAFSWSDAVRHVSPVGKP